MLVLVALGASAASASAAGAAPYGEVQRFGGLDTGATYGPSTTTGLKDIVGESAKFVYPIGMAVDTEDPSAPDKYAIYVLDNVNPQALNEELISGSTQTMALEYRIQKLDEHGTVLASKAFTLTSSGTEANLHATGLAVDTQADRVYVLIADAAPGNTNDGNASVKIDAWTSGRHGTALAPAVGLSEGADDELPEDPMTGGGELAGPDTSRPEALQSSAGFEGDIDGESIAVDGADLALAGNEYTSSGSTFPVIERFKTTGSSTAGELDGAQWTDVADTEDAAAQTVGQASSELYSMSTNGDGSLNVTLGPTSKPAVADREPNMATVSGALDSTTAVLPWADAAEDSLAGGAPNSDRVATNGFLQDVESSANAFQPFGATPRAGTLAPSVQQLAGDGVQFPAGLYAGVVSQSSSKDRQNPSSGSEYSWQYAQGLQSNGTRSLERNASLAIRVFNSQGESLATIGNPSQGGPCNMQSSPTAFNFAYRGGSFVAIAPGRDGTLFALVQPDLLNTIVSSAEPIDPASAVGGGMGDQVVEFAPGAGQNGAAGTKCPQPTGGFSVTNETLHESLGEGSGEVAVQAGTTLKFDAAAVNLQGGAPWAYDWDLEGAVNKVGQGPIFDLPWTPTNEFTAEPGAGNPWTWADPTMEVEYKTAGFYTEKLNLVNDFGTLSAQRTVRVIDAGEITGAKITVPAGVAVNQPVLLKASATLPQGDKVKNYHWDFGDGQGEDTGEAAEAQHSYQEAKAYTVTLTVTDALGKTAETTETVTIAAPSKEKHEEKSPVKQEAPAAKQEAPVSKVEAPVVKPPAIVAKQKPLTNAQKLANALKLCKKKPTKQRVSCEKQAKKKYAPKPKAKKKKSTKKK